MLTLECNAQTAISLKHHAVTVFDVGLGCCIVSNYLDKVFWGFEGSPIVVK